MRLGRLVFSDVRILAVLCGTIILAYYVGRQVAGGDAPSIAVMLVVLTSCVALFNPPLGVYTFFFVLLLVPFDWRLGGQKLGSPALIIIGASVTGWAVSTAVGRSRLRFGRLYVPLLIAIIITWMNLWRYGTGFWNVPLILTESFILFLIGYHLIRNQSRLMQLLVALALAVTIRNFADVALSISEILGGNPVGAIRVEHMLIPGAATTESELRGLLIPLFIAGVLLPRNPWHKAIFGVALLSDVSWLALAATRTAIIGLVVAPVFTFAFLPASRRGRLLILTLPLILLVVWLAGSFSEAWAHVISKTQTDVDRGLDYTRVQLWREAWDAFVAGPIVGTGPGHSHSYLLAAARTMGLVFLIPLFIVLWMVWRHGRWLRRQSLDSTSQVLVIGLQASMVLVVGFSITGAMLQGAVNAFIFWLLVGVQEAIYLDVKSGRYAMAKLGTSMPDFGGRRSQQSQAVGGAGVR